jgi:hypothetical protein
MGAVGRNPAFKIRGFRLLICETQITTQVTRFAISMTSLFCRSSVQARHTGHIAFLGHFCQAAECWPAPEPDGSSVLVMVRKDIFAQPALRVSGGLSAYMTF